MQPSMARMLISMKGLFLKEEKDIYVLPEYRYEYTTTLHA